MSELAAAVANSCAGLLAASAKPMETTELTPTAIINVRTMFIPFSFEPNRFTRVEPARRKVVPSRLKEVRRRSPPRSQLGGDVVLRTNRQALSWQANWPPTPR